MVREEELEVLEESEDVVEETVEEVEEDEEEVEVDEVEEVEDAEEAAAEDVSEESLADEAEEPFSLLDTGFKFPLSAGVVLVVEVEEIEVSAGLLAPPMARRFFLIMALIKTPIKTRIIAPMTTEAITIFFFWELSCST